MMNLINKYLIVIFVLAVTGMAAGDSLAENRPASDPDTAEKTNPVHAVRDKVLSYFIPASGVVIGVEENTVRVRLKTGVGLSKGMRFSVLREGTPFYHPVTKELLGRSEELAGRIEISEIRSEPGTSSDETVYVCRIVSGVPTVGDVVRITSSKIKLAFFQDKNAEWTLSENFYRSLVDSGRFSIMEAYAKANDPEELAVLSRDMGAEAVLFLSTPVRNKNIFLNAKLFWSSDSEVIGEAEEVVGISFTKELASEQELISMISGDREPWSRHELVDGELMAMGNVDGNDGKELVVSDGVGIRIYKFEQEPQEIWYIKGSPKERILSIDVLDVNKNGRDEIFVSAIKDVKINVNLEDGEVQKNERSSSMTSYVIEYDPEEGYRKIWDKAPYILRVVGNTLVMQNYSPYNGINGAVYAGMWKNEKYLVGRPLELPAGINIFGFTYVDWQNTGHPDIVAFNDRGYLTLYRGKELIWKSKDSYGGFDTSFKQKSFSIERTKKEWFVKGRLLTVRTSRGQEIIAVKRVPFAAIVPGAGFKKTEVYSLWWDGGIMEEELILGGINGNITDYWVDGDNLMLIGKLNLLGSLSKMLSGDFIMGSVLYYYNLAGK